jgi:hypothetical protein
MIPEESYPELGVFIRGLPELFKHSEITGVFLGNEICASLLHSAESLEKIVFYENFFAVEDTKFQEHLQQEYVNWQSEVPKLTVKIEDGINYDRTADFIHIDINHGILPVLSGHGEELQHALLGTCGFGRDLSSTLQLSEMILSDIIFPVMLYRDLIFFTVNKDTKETIYNKVLAFLSHNSELYYSLDGNIGVIKLETVAPYSARLQEKFED